MKHTLILLATATTFIFTACKNENKCDDDKNCVKTHKYHYHTGAEYDTSEYYIPIDSCNKMIGSYLTSINYRKNDTDLYDLLYNADSLRSYLVNPNVKHIKFMFAHTLDYINSGGQGKYAGYQAGALTLVIAGYDSADNYVFAYHGSTIPMALDHCNPCPNMCPSHGSAQSDFLMQNPTNDHR